MVVVIGRVVVVTVIELLVVRVSSMVLWKMVLVVERR